MMVKSPGILSPIVTLSEAKDPFNRGQRGDGSFGCGLKMTISVRALSGRL